MGRVDKDTLQLLVEGNLYLRNGENAKNTFWELPEINEAPVSPFRHQAIGLPFAYVEGYSNGRIKVLGVVEVQGSAQR